MRTRSTKHQIEQLRAETRYCECGCGGELPPPVCRTRIPRFLNGHNKFLPGLPYTIDPATGCWNWTRGTTDDGYGRLVRDNRKWLAHVWYYTQKHGPVPDGKQLDHTCRNRGCCNPDHVEPVTHIENIHRSRVVKLTEEIVQEVMRLKGTMTQKEIAKKYGISKTHVGALHRGKIRRWLQ